jgi:hypothetical protein
MMQSIAWALLIAAVLLQLFAARQQMVTWGSTSIGDAKSCQGSRRAYIAGVASALASIHRRTLVTSFGIL